jgi:hypothetical protein
MAWQSSESENNNVENIGKANRKSKMASKHGNISEMASIISVMKAKMA